MNHPDTASTHFHLPTLQRWAAFIAMSIGMFMAVLDIQVVVTSLHVIEEELGIGADRMSWVQTSYLIAEVVAIPIIGLLMRVFAKRRLFIYTLLIFVIASIGCAISQGFWDLMAWRILQGFAGGVLIPLIFSAVFLMFPKGIEQTLATTVGGFLAILAPTLGPMVGGWITENYSWHWLFLINIGPGIIALILGLLSLPKEDARYSILCELDWLSLLAFGVSLALLIIGLKEAPKQGWLSAIVLLCFAGAIASLIFSVKRKQPAIMFHLLNDRALAFGCALSFMFGFVLFASVYILPVFLAFVRGHGPLAIGMITIVMGFAQIIVAPIVVNIDRFFDARHLTAFGFIGFGIGLAMNGSFTVASDYDDAFWPQIVRGAFIMFCILPSIRMALALQPLAQVNDASGLFNVQRNIGGAIGIAVMDTLMFSRAPLHADTISGLIPTNPAEAARLLGMAVEELPDPDDAMGFMGLMSSLEQASLTMAINECWWVLAAVCFAALPLLWLTGPVDSAKPVPRVKS